MLRDLLFELSLGRELDIIEECEEFVSRRLDLNTGETYIARSEASLVSEPILIFTNCSNGKSEKVVGLRIPEVLDLDEDSPRGREILRTLKKIKLKTVLE